MRRRNKIIYMQTGFVLLLLLVSSLFSSCEVVYTAGLSGTVVDAEGAGISGVEIYAYLSSEEASEKAKAFVSEPIGSVFSDPSCLFMGVTGQGGNFSIPKIVFSEKSPGGEDVGSTSVFLLFWSKEYGLIEGAGAYNLISGATNNVVKMELTNPIMTNGVINVSGGSPPQSIYLEWSYDNGYGPISNSTNFNLSNYNYQIQITYLTAKGEPIVRVTYQKQGEEPKTSEITMSSPVQSLEIE